jgi:hypothetical protein
MFIIGVRSFFVYAFAWLPAVLVPQQQGTCHENKRPAGATLRVCM